MPDKKDPTIAVTVKASDHMERFWWAWFLGVIAIFFATGWFFGGRSTTRIIHCEAAEAGAGFYSSDAVTGEVEFRWLGVRERSDEGENEQ